MHGLFSSQSGSRVDDMMSQNQPAMRAPKQPVMVRGCLERVVLESLPKWLSCGWYDETKPAGYACSKATRNGAWLPRKRAILESSPIICSHVDEDLMRGALGGLFVVVQHGERWLFFHRMVYSPLYMSDVILACVREFSSHAIVCHYCLPLSILNSVSWSPKGSPTKNLLNPLLKIPRKPHQNPSLCWLSFFNKNGALLVNSFWFFWCRWSHVLKEKRKKKHVLFRGLWQCLNLGFKKSSCSDFEISLAKGPPARNGLGDGLANAYGQKRVW